MSVVRRDKQQGILQSACKLRSCFFYVCKQFLDVGSIDAVFVHGSVGLIPIGIDILSVFAMAKPSDFFAESIIVLGKRLCKRRKVMGIDAGFFYFAKETFIGNIGVRHIVIQLFSRIVVLAEKVHNIFVYFIKITCPSKPAGLVGKQTAVGGGGSCYGCGWKGRGIHGLYISAKKAVFGKVFF